MAVISVRSAILYLWSREMKNPKILHTRGARWIERNMRRRMIPHASRVVCIRFRFIGGAPHSKHYCRPGFMLFCLLLVTERTCFGWHNHIGIHKSLKRAQTVSILFFSFISIYWKSVQCSGIRSSKWHITSPHTDFINNNIVRLLAASCSIGILCLYAVPCWKGQPILDAMAYAMLNCITYSGF